MADRAGSLVALRVNSGPVTIRVTNYDYDPEKRVNRAVTSDANQNPRSIITSIGGKLVATGYVDPSDAGVTLMLAAASATVGVSQDLTSVKFILDISVTAASRPGWTMGASKLIIGKVSGETDGEGMTKIDFEIHTQGGATYSTTLT